MNFMEKQIFAILAIRFELWLGEKDIFVYSFNREETLRVSDSVKRV